MNNSFSGYKIISVFLLLIYSITIANTQENTIGVTDVTWDVTEGFTIFSGARKTFVVNNCGQLIKEWESENRVSFSAYLLENGHLLRTASSENFGYFFGGIIEEFNWEGDLIWSFEINNDDYVQHHDIEPLPNGNILVLCYNFIEPIEAWNSGALDTLEYWSTSIFELKPLELNQAEVVWEWHLWDHLYQNIDSTRLNYSSFHHPELFDINEMYFPSDSVVPGFYTNHGPDWMHMNSIDYNVERDEILLSSRDHNEIFIIDHSTNADEAASHSGGYHNMGGDFIYRFGRDEFYGQHDAHWVNRPDYNENAIVVFNNGFRYEDESRFYSSVDMFIPKIDSNGNYIHYEVDTFQVLLKLDNPDREYSEIMGSAQILDNDRILICNSERGRFIEYDTSRNIKWRYVNPLAFNGPNTQGNQRSGPLIFRAKKLPLNYPAFDNGYEIGDPIEFDFNIRNCLGTTSVDDSFEDQIIEIYPNPASQNLTFKSNLTFSRINLYNTYGQLFLPKETNTHNWDVQNIPNGFYLAVLFTTEGDVTTKKIIIQH